MAQVNAYLRFQDNCRQAMTFYTECLGGELTLMTVGDSPMAAQVPPEAKNHIMHSQLKNGNSVLMASDNMGSGSITKGNQFSMTIPGRSTIPGPDFLQFSCQVTWLN